MGSRIYVGGLPYAVDEPRLGDLFTEHGNVESVRVITDRVTGRSRGFGFVEMASDEEAAAAIEALNGSEMDGRTLTVNEARPLEPRFDGDRFGQGPGGGRSDRDRHRSGPRGGRSGNNRNRW
jgi:RNA recognition motif-containing protein